MSNVCLHIASARPVADDLGLVSGLVAGGKEENSIRYTRDGEHIASQRTVAHHRGLVSVCALENGGGLD